MSSIETTDHAHTAITNEEVERLIDGIEALHEELADKLRWARERGFCIGEGAGMADEYTDQLVYLRGAVTGHGGASHRSCACTPTAPCGSLLAATHSAEPS